MTKTMLVAMIAVGVVGATGGCYSKVVGGKGIGADSRHLRKNHEYGSDWAPQDSGTTTKDRQRR
ncbi:MAG: hypothetical protein COB69_10145 [Phycisphaera sp.]|nr:MAG: hypothetical protein COB69_10145 [Phycisphaera sp.]